jgi:CRISPR system Cascade subunit CasD
MDTLLIRLIAPMQSWGVQSHYTDRDSGLEPSKSGVIGLLCAALGRPRDLPVADLASLKMGVRVDREGIQRNDFHIVQDVLDSNGKGIRPSIITHRHYLADAAFLVGLEGEHGLLSELQTALQHPVWALFLGRKAFPPSLPVWLPDGLMEDCGLEEAFQRYAWIVARHERSDSPQLRVVLEDPQGEMLHNDVPVSFSKRIFTSRRVRVDFLDAKDLPLVEVP